MTNRELADTFITAWQKGQQTFELTTSGSTGAPTTITLQRAHMQWSARNTGSILKPLPTDSILCCLPCNKVGGLMMLVRALEWQIPLEITEPSSNPYTTAFKVSLVSLTPHQLHTILKDKKSTEHLLSARAVLLGGGMLDSGLENRLKEQPFNNTIFYHTYGMTETYSHIALRAVNGPEASAYFKPFADVKITVNENKCAVITLPFSHSPLVTSDIIQLQPDGHFTVTGRADFIINTGGVKLQPELIEKAIHEKLNPLYAFIIKGEADAALGERLVLLAEKHFDYTLDDLQFLKTIHPYAVPKEIKITDLLERNEGGKIKRK